MSGTTILQVLYYIIGYMFRPIYRSIYKAKLNIPSQFQGQTHRVSFLALRSTHTATPKGNKARHTLRPQGIVQAPNMTEDHNIQKWHYIEV